MVSLTLVVSLALQRLLLGGTDCVTPEAVVGQLRDGVAGHNGDVQSGALLTSMDGFVCLSGEVGDQEVGDE